MDPLPPIPTPASQRWREFRIQILPLIVFVFVVAMVALLWRGFVQPVGVIGEVEAVKANVTSLQDGLITDLNVDLLQPVKAGEVIGHLQVRASETLRAELATLEAELQITGVRSTVDERRRMQDLAGLKLSFMDQQAQLASDQAQLVQSSNTFDRVRSVYLNKDGVYSPDEYDIAERDFKKYDSFVRFRTALVDTLGKLIQNMDSEGPVDVKTPIEAAIKKHQEELETIYGAVALRAPIDGVVSVVFRRKGERVVTGEPLLTVSSPRGNRIVGYLRQPIVAFPSTNDTVMITTRGHPRRKGTGQILSVGTQFDIVRPGLLSPDTARVDTGLTILVTLPDGLDVIPGELVDLSIKYAKN